MVGAQRDGQPSGWSLYVVQLRLSSMAWFYQLSQQPFSMVEPIHALEPILLPDACKKALAKAETIGSNFTLLGAVCMFVMSPGIALLCDRYGRKPVLIFGQVVGFISVVSLVAVDIFGISLYLYYALSVVAASCCVQAWWSVERSQALWIIIFKSTFSATFRALKHSHVAWNRYLVLCNSTVPWVSFTGLAQVVFALWIADRTTPEQRIAFFATLAAAMDVEQILLPVAAFVSMRRTDTSTFGPQTKWENLRDHEYCHSMDHFFWTGNICKWIFIFDSVYLTCWSDIEVLKKTFLRFVKVKPMKFDVTRSVPFERRLLLSAILSLIALMATVLCIPESLPESRQRLWLGKCLIHVIYKLSQWIGNVLVPWKLRTVGEDPFEWTWDRPGRSCRVAGLMDFNFQKKVSWDEFRF